MFNIFEYSFYVVAIGTMILGMATAVIGSISVFKGQSLIGDAIGHSTLPGIILIFMLFQQRSVLILVIGAFISGAFAFYLIQTVKSYSKVSFDSVLAIVLSGMFGLGMVLKSFIQGNAQYASASQAGLDNYIFGQAAYIRYQDVTLISIVAIISLLLFVVFYKEIKLFIFDEMQAKLMGYRPRLLNIIVLIMTMLLIGVGLKAVGAILISSLLVAPTVIGSQWSNRYLIVVIIGSFVSGTSAFIGTMWSSIYGASTGAAIIVVLSFFAIVSLLFSPKGIIPTAIRRIKGGKK